LTSPEWVGQLGDLHVLRHERNGALPHAHRGTELEEKVRAANIVRSDDDGDDVAGAQAFVELLPADEHLLHARLPVKAADALLRQADQRIAMLQGVLLTAQ
jgi:hypothetical protein